MRATLSLLTLAMLLSGCTSSFLERWAYERDRYILAKRLDAQERRPVTTWCDTYRRANGSLYTSCNSW